MLPVLTHEGSISEHPHIYFMRPGLTNHTEYISVWAVVLQEAQAAR